MGKWRPHLKSSFPKVPREPKVRERKGKFGQKPRGSPHLRLMLTKVRMRDPNIIGERPQTEGKRGLGSRRMLTSKVKKTARENWTRVDSP